MRGCLRYVLIGLGALGALMALLVVVALFVGEPELADVPDASAQSVAPTGTSIAQVEDEQPAPTAIDPPSPTSGPLPPDTSTATNPPPPMPTDTPVPTAAQPRGSAANNAANLRSGPGTEYDVVGGVAAGDALTILGRNQAGDWYQLDSGAWIAGFLVENPPGDVVAVAEALPLPAATPVSTVAQPRGSTANSAANLRSGPGTEYDVVGGVAAGDALTIVGRNAASDWYQLDSGVWIAGFLVDNAPGDLLVEQTEPPIPTQLPAPVAQGRQAAQVVNVVDGDTIDVVIGGQEYRVRYILMNTPETNQVFGSEATEKNRELVAGQTVYLEKDVSETDRYGRLLRYVYLPDGTFVNKELVRLGYAQIATYPPDVSKEAEIRAAQQEAMNASRGLWVQQQAAPTPTVAFVPQPTQPPQPQGNCDPSYPDVCIPRYPPDLDCGQISFRRFRVVGADPHGFDGDNDGIGCESG